ncbi:MAG TPA: hemerythrin domain-containing protein [Acetobacteraceae bacterium]|nr:hemerythrin domain-containing protein [Acetobacteraceae bacterium]
MATLAAAELARLETDHARLLEALGRVRKVADGLATMAAHDARPALAEVDGLVREQLLPHESTHKTELCPRIERALGGGDRIASMHRTHRELALLGQRLRRMVSELPPDGPDLDAMNDFRRVLYGLDAILQLHVAQENELYRGLA